MMASTVVLPRNIDFIPVFQFNPWTISAFGLHRDSPSNRSPVDPDTLPTTTCLDPVLAISFIIRTVCCILAEKRVLSRT